MKIQTHNLMKNKALNAGIAYLHEHRTIALGLLIFSITICWAKELKDNGE